MRQKEWRRQRGRHSDSAAAAADGPAESWPYGKIATVSSMWHRRKGDWPHTWSSCSRTRSGVGETERYCSDTAIVPGTWNVTGGGRENEGTTYWILCVICGVFGGEKSVAAGWGRSQPARRDGHAFFVPAKSRQTSSHAGSPTLHVCDGLERTPTRPARTSPVARAHATDGADVPGAVVYLLAGARPRREPTHPLPRLGRYQSSIHGTCQVAQPPANSDAFPPRPPTRPAPRGRGVPVVALVRRAGREYVHRKILVPIPLTRLQMQ